MKRYSVTFSPDLDPSIYVVMLYEVVGGGDLLQSREWFRSLRSLNHNEEEALLIGILIAA